MLLCEYPSRKLIHACGNSVRSISVIRRVVAKVCGEELTRIVGVEVDGFSGLASKS